MEDYSNKFKTHLNKYNIVLVVSTIHLKLNRLGGECQMLSLKINWIISHLNSNSILAMMLEEVLIFKPKTVKTTVDKCLSAQVMVPQNHLFQVQLGFMIPYDKEEVLPWLPKVSMLEVDKQYQNTAFYRNNFEKITIILEIELSIDLLNKRAFNH